VFYGAGDGEKHELECQPIGITVPTGVTTSNVVVDVSRVACNGISLRVCDGTRFLDKPAF
jgi:hypothetical protein